MGWHEVSFCTRKQLIQQLTETRTTNEGYTTAAIRRCYRGAAFKGCLWTVWEVTDDLGNMLERWIGCDLLEYFRYSDETGWRYKPLDEGMGPTAYSCPLGYLKLVPEDEFPQSVDADWRRSVHAYHERIRCQKKTNEKSRI